MTYGGWEIALNNKETVKISFLIKPKDKDHLIPREEVKEKLNSLTDNITKDVLGLMRDKYQINTVNIPVTPVLEEN